jgi:hypothetical protein
MDVGIVPHLERIRRASIRLQPPSESIAKLNVAILVLFLAVVAVFTTGLTDVVGVALSPVVGAVVLPLLQHGPCLVSEDAEVVVTCIP